ncbi:hypothetical protein J2X67_005585 [Variovorax sp. 3319]|nr:hypothetical protein [Variovorax sp. 3319]
MSPIDSMSALRLLSTAPWPVALRLASSAPPMFIEPAPRPPLKISACSRLLMVPAPMSRVSRAAMVPALVTPLAVSASLLSVPAAMEIASP